jgi:hypothetical protein
MAASCNAYYGHNAILARYAGLARPRPMYGYLLHGWHPWFPWMPDTKVIRDSVPPGVPVLAWSHRDRDHLEAGGVRSVRVIGAPFLYLLEMEGTPDPPRDRSLIVFPFHEVEAGGNDQSWEDYADYLEGLAYDRVTVCVYPTDYDDHELRAVFTRRGFATVTNGTRDDPRFLYNLRAAVGSHTDVTSNRISTALVYGAAMGRRAFLGGPVPGVTVQQTAGPMVGEAGRAEEFQREHFREFVDGVEADRARALARSLLGGDALLEPAELRNAVGWSGGRQVAARGLAVAAAARRRVSVRGS